MRHYQCLFYGLDKWHANGGYIKFRRSSHWCIPHVLHEDRDGKLSHFVPHHDLPRAKKSVFGFLGSVQFEDTAPALPMTLHCMLGGTLLLLIGGGVWAVRKVITDFFRPIP